MFHIFIHLTSTNVLISKIEITYLKFDLLLFYAFKVYKVKFPQIYYVYYIYCVCMSAAPSSDTLSLIIFVHTDSFAFTHSSK